MSLLSNLKERLNSSKQAFTKVAKSVYRNQTLNKVANFGESVYQSGLTPFKKTPDNLLKNKTPSIFDPIGSVAGGVDLAKSVARQFPRVGARLPLTGMELVTGEPATITPKTDFQKFLLGNEDVTSIQTGARRNKDWLKGVGVPETPALVLGAAGTVASTVLDLGDVLDLGAFGATKKLGKEAVEKLSKEFGEDAVSKLFRGKLDDVTKESMKQFVKNLPEFANKKAVDSVKEATKVLGGSGSITSLSSSEDVLKAAYKEIGSLVPAKAPFKERLSKGLDAFYTDWVNSWYPVEKYADEVARKSGLELTSVSDPKYQIKRLLGAGGVAEYRHKKVLQPILDQVGDIAKEDFDVFLKAKRDIGFGEVGRDILGSDADLANRRITALTEKYGPSVVERMEETATRLYEYQNNSLKSLRDIGFIDEEGYQLIRGQNVNYVPYKRVMEEVEGYIGLGAKGQVGTNVVKKIEGSEKNIFSPVESIIEDTYKMEQAVAKNRVASSIADLRNIYDTGDIKPLRTAENVRRRVDIFSDVHDLNIDKRKLDRLIQTRNRWSRIIQSELNRLNREGINSYLRAKPVEGVARKTVVLKQRFSNKTGRVLSEDIIPVQYGARETRRLVNDLINQTPEGINAIKKKIGVRDSRLKEVMDDIDTLRDSLTTVRGSRAQLLEEARLIKDAESKGKATLSVWRDGVKELYEVPKEIEAVVKGLNDETTNSLTKVLSMPSSLFRQGQTGRNIDFMIPNIVKDQFDAAINSRYGYRPFIDYINGLGHLIKYDRAGSDALVEAWIKGGGNLSFGKLSGRKELAEQVLDATTKKGLLKRMADWFVEGLDTVGRYSETPTRLGLAERALEKTGDIGKAVMESREATVDFARMGAKMKTANSLIPFLNPSVQGFDKMVRVFKKDPKAFMLRAGIYGAMPAVMTALYNNIFHSDEYNSIPQWEKDTNFVIITGGEIDGKPSYIKIPKGNVVPLIANPVENFISYLYDNDRKSFSSLVLSLMSEALPVVGGGDNIPEIVRRTVGSNLPQAVKGPVENITNYDFFTGSPVVPFYTSKKEPSQQFSSNTPEVYKSAGLILNASPNKIQQLVESYLAGFIKTPVNIVETINAIGRGETVNPNYIPILRRFLGNYEDYTAKGSSSAINFPKASPSPKPTPRPTPKPNPVKK